MARGYLEDMLGEAAAAGRTLSTCAVPSLLHLKNFEEREPNLKTPQHKEALLNLSGHDCLRIGTD